MLQARDRAQREEVKIDAVHLKCHRQTGGQIKKKLSTPASRRLIYNMPTVFCVAKYAYAERGPHILPLTHTRMFAYCHIGVSDLDKSRALKST